MSDSPLTTQEEEVLLLLAKAWNAFVSLKPVHEWDRVEFQSAIHAAQNIVLARPAKKNITTSRNVVVSPIPTFVTSERKKE